MVKLFHWKVLFSAWNMMFCCNSINSLIYLEFSWAWPLCWGFPTQTLHQTPFEPAGGAWQWHWTYTLPSRPPYALSSSCDMRIHLSQHKRLPSQCNSCNPPRGQLWLWSWRLGININSTVERIIWSKVQTQGLEGSQKVYLAWLWPQQK